MNDPIKEFVEQNREAFDQLEAPVFDLERLKTRMNQSPAKKNKTLFLFSGRKWLVAASLLIATGITFLLLNREYQVISSDKLVVQKIKPIPAMPGRISDGTDEGPDRSLQNKKTVIVQDSKRTIKAKQKVISLSNSIENLYARLSDSTSSSSRLSAILDIDKSGLINNSVIDKLYKTLNQDGNSNVRLAALSVMEKYSNDNYVSSRLIASLNTQTDPMVQLGLVSMLSKMKNINISDRLYALANDPNTFAAVKDEAYNVLLKEDKL